MKREIVLLSQKIFFLFISITFVFAGIAFGEELYPTGLLPPTEKELILMEKEWNKMDFVYPTDLAVDRANITREKARQPALEKDEIMRQWRRNFEQAETELEASSLPKAAQVPYVDNSNLSAFPPIRTQGGLPSCVPFSINYYQLTHMVGIQRGWNNKNEKNTTKFSPKWSYNMINGGNSAGTSWYSAYNVIVKHGAATWEEFPYIGSSSDPKNYREWCLDSKIWENAIVFRTEPVQYINDMDQNTGLELAKQLLQNGYVLIFGTYVYAWQYTKIKDDPHVSEDYEFVGKDVCYWLKGTGGSHSMTLVGYNDDIWVDINNNNSVDIGEKGAFRIANSWGQGWMDDGFVWLAYDALRWESAVPGGPSEERWHAFHGDSAYLIMPKVSYSPKAVAEFTVNHPRRVHLGITLGISISDESFPQIYWYPGAINFQGGDFAFDGTQTPCNGHFAFDFTELYELFDIDFPEIEKRAFYLGVNENSGDGATLESFKVIDFEFGGISYLAKDIPLYIENDTAYSRILQGNTNLVTITNLSVASGKPYEIVYEGLSEGAPVYIDRQYTITGYPASLEGAVYIQTANDDKRRTESDFLSFEVNQDVTVYVAHDLRIANKPAWLDEFAQTGDDLLTSDAVFTIFAKDFPVGVVTLGGNAGSGNSSMYVVIVVPKRNL